MIRFLELSCLGQRITMMRLVVRRKRVLRRRNSVPVDVRRIVGSGGDTVAIAIAGHLIMRKS
jgi:hypothetical protein